MEIDLINIHEYISFSRELLCNHAFCSKADNPMSSFSNWLPQLHSRKTDGRELRDVEIIWATARNDQASMLVVVGPNSVAGPPEYNVMLLKNDIVTINRKKLTGGNLPTLSITFAKYQA